MKLSADYLNKLGRLLLILIFSLALYIPLFSQDIVVSGYIRDDQSGEFLPGVLVSTIEAKPVTSFTNNYGFYSLKHSKSDSITLKISSFAYQTLILKVSGRENTVLNIGLVPEINQGKEILLKGQKPKPEKEEGSISSIEIPLKQMKEVPALLGEKDVLKVIQLMPGVQKGGEGNTALYVRGGGPGENLILLDGAPIYNAGHLFGFFSIFNGDALKSAELIKGGFPARYGGRLSSVVNLTMKEGNKKRFAGEGSVGLISARATLEGPLIKGKSSFMISGRRTYLDALVAPFLPYGKKNRYYFYDLNGKINYDINHRNKVFLSAYTGKDEFSLQDKKTFGFNKADISWGNSTATLRWNHLFRDDIFSNTSLVCSGFDLKIKQTDDLINQRLLLDYTSRIRDISFRSDFEISTFTQHYIRTGISVTRHSFNPIAMVMPADSIYADRGGLKPYISTESGLYIEDEFKPAEKITILGGMRFSSFLIKKKSYFLPEPRISVSYRFLKDFSFKAAYSLMNQYQHLLSSSSLGLPADLWVPATDYVGPARSSQVAGGFVKEFLTDKISVSLEGYYKNTARLVGFKEETFFGVNDGKLVAWEKNVTTGNGWSYGAEFLIHKKSGRFSGWIGYTLSWTWLKFPEINKGEKFFARYDRRHDASVVLIYRITENIKLSGTWVYGTGNAMTLREGRYYAAIPGSGVPAYFNDPVNNFSKRNAYRMKPYHRADIGLQFDKELKSNRVRTWEIGIYNLYNRKNVFYYYYDQNEITKKTAMMKVTVFPLIPSLNYRLQF
jgi:hypothetical protein